MKVDKQNHDNLQAAVLTSSGGYGTLRAGSESWDDEVGKYLMIVSHSKYHDSSITSVRFQNILYHL